MRSRFRAKKIHYQPADPPCIFYVPGKSSIVAHARIFLFHRHAAGRDWTVGWELFMRQIVRGLHTASPPMRILWSRTPLTTVCIIDAYVSARVYTENFRTAAWRHKQSNWTGKIYSAIADIKFVEMVLAAKMIKENYIFKNAEKLEKLLSIILQYLYGILKKKKDNIEGIHKLHIPNYSNANIASKLKATFVFDKICLPPFSRFTRDHFALDRLLFHFSIHTPFPT